MLVEGAQLSKGLCSVSAKHRGQQRDRVRERKRKTELGGRWAALCSAPGSLKMTNAPESKQ